MFAKGLGATAAAVGASVALLGAFACNAVTGADGVRINPDWDDEGANQNETGAGPTSGAGAATSAGPGAGPAGSGGNSTGGNTGNGGTGTGGDEPSECEYPAGPYGVAEGQTVPPTITWQGYAPGASSPSTIAITDFFDCDGTRGINALYFDTSQFG